MQKSKCFALLLAALMLLGLGQAVAEETTLIYSYGEDARLKNMLDVLNVTVYNGEEWTFVQGDVAFDGAFNMYGGNTHTVWECEVPEIRADVLHSNTDENLGKVTINAPGAMTVYAFSGDRAQGKYTLVDSQEGIYGYTLDLIATRNENGVLRVIDKVFLYSYEENGEKKNYAASVYISYGSYTGAPADALPVTAVVSREAPVAAEPAAQGDESASTYAAMIRILDEERNRLSAQVTTLQEEIAALKAGTAGESQLETQVESLNVQLQTKDSEIAALKKEKGELEDKNSALEAEVAGLSETIDELNIQLAAAMNAMADMEDYKKIIEELEKENIMLRASEDSGKPAETQAPAATEDPTIVPTQAPTPVVTATPTPTQAPTPVVTATPTPTQAPTPVITATPAPIDITFKKGEKVQIFDQNGVKLTFTGVVEDEGRWNLNLKVLVENQTSNTVMISYHGACNGWSINGAGLGGNASMVAPNSKGQGEMWLSYEELDITRFSDLREATLTFTVQNGDSWTTLFTVPNVHITFGTGEPEEIVPTYFEYYPELPDPTAYGAMYESSRSGPTKINGIPSSSVVYKYRSVRSDELAAAFDTYIAALKTMGFGVSKSGGQYAISHQGKKIAVASCSDVIKVEILASAIVVEKEDTEAALDVVEKAMGDTLSTSYMSFKAEKTGKADAIYSYETYEPRWYRYWEAQPGKTFVYLKGTFKNKTNAEIDIRNIYTNLLIDNQYNYKGDVCALRADGEDFYNYVSAQDTVTCVIRFEVPDSVASSMKSGVVRLGFTSTFNTKISAAGSGVYDFSRCEDVFEVSLQGKSGSTSNANKTTGNRTAANNAESQNAAQQTTAPAEPITFQGIAWGSSPDAARSALVKAGYIKSKSAMYGEEGASSSMLTTANEKSPYELPFGYEKVLYEDWIYSDVQKTVGGYDVSSISMLYCYGIKNGKLDKNTKELISVNVELNAPDTTAAMEDLFKKLESLYGPCVSNTFAGKVWRGADNTCVVLYDFAAPVLLYGKWGNLEQIQDMYNKLGFAPSADDASGL